MASPVAKVILQAEHRGKAAFKSFNSDLQGIATAAKVVAAATAAALAGVTGASFASADALGDVADKLGITTEELASLRLAAQQTGVEANNLDTGLQRMARRIAEVATTGRGSAKPALDALGLSIEDLSKLNAAGQFREIAEAMNGLDSAGARVLASFGLFDTEGVDLVRTTALGKEGLDEMAETADKLGLALDRVAVAKIQEANDAMLLIKSSAVGIGNAFAVELAPVITAVSNQFLQASTDAKTLQNTARSTIDGIAFGVGLLADAWHGWRIIISGTELLVRKVDAAFQDVLDTLAIFETDTATTIKNLEDVFEIQTAGFGEEQKELAREVLDLQIAALGVRGKAGLVADVELFALQLQHDELLAMVKPSQDVRDGLAEARDNAQAAGEALAAAAEQRRFVDPRGTVAPGADEAVAQERRDREQAASAEAQARALEQVRTFTLTRAEVETEATNRRLEIVRNAFDDELIEFEQFWELKTLVEERGQMALDDINKKGLTERQKFEELSGKQKAAFTLGTLSQITAGSANENKKLFQLNKAAGIGNAVMHTAEGVSRALKDFPVPINFAMAAAVAAAGAAQIQAIKSASFGGGTTPSVAGSVPSVNNQPVQALPDLSFDSARDAPRVDLTVNGSVVGIGGAEELVDFIQESLSDRLNNNDEVLFTSSSRQAGVR